MDIAELRIFEAVARRGTMNGAANELNTVQSNVTAHIRRLERDLNTRLFERHSRGVQLTPAGARLLPIARRAIGLLTEARDVVTEAGDPRGPLTIGALETTLALRLAPRLAAFAARHPSVDLNLRTGTTAELVAAVLASQIEGAFVCGPLEHPQLVHTAVFAERLALFSPPAWGQPDAIWTRPGLTQLVLRSGCSYRQRLESIVARRGVPAVRTQEFGTLEAIVACVAAGVGITLLPAALAGAVWPADRVRCHLLEDKETQADTVFVRRRDAYVSTAQKALLDTVAEGAPRAEAAQ